MHSTFDHEALHVRSCGVDGKGESGHTFAYICIDASLYLLLFLAPLFLAGRHPSGELVLVFAALPGALGVLVLACAGKNLPVSNLVLLTLVACIAIPLLQTVQVSPDLLSQLMPGLDRLFSDVTSEKTIVKTVSTLSVSPLTTKQAFPLVLTYVCVFVVAVTRLQTLKDIRRLMLLLMLSGMFLAGLALLQASYGNEKFLWLYDHPSRVPGNVPRGPFQNENHLCSLIASICPCVLYLLVWKEKDESGFQAVKTSRKRAKGFASFSRWLAMIACVLFFGVVCGTKSRGGACVIALSGAMWCLILGWHWLAIKCRHRVSLQTSCILGGLLVATAVGAIVIGLFLNIDHLSVWRARLWAADFAAWRDFPVLGIGVGNHRFIYRAYLEAYSPQTFSIAESSWIQLLVETGSCGFVLALVTAFAVLASLIRKFMWMSSHLLFLGAAVFAGLLASCVHSIADFPWHIPACFVVVLILVAITLSISRVADACRQASSRCGFHLVDTKYGSILVASCLFAAQIWAFFAAVPPARAAYTWDQYRRFSRDHDMGELLPEEEFQATELLQQTLVHHPNHTLARTRLVSLLSARLERRRYQNDEAQQLTEQIRREAARVIAVCPTESRPYFFLALLAKETGASVDVQDRLLRQSQRLRVVDGRVALQRGIIAIILQDDERIMQQFEVAMEKDSSCRAAAVQVLLAFYSPSEIVQRWDPSFETSSLLYEFAGEMGGEVKKVIGKHYCQRLIERANSKLVVAESDHLLEAAFKVAEANEDSQLMIQVAAMRIKQNPENVSLRILLAEVYLQLNLVGNARAVLDTCDALSPKNRDLQNLSLRVAKLEGFEHRSIE